MSHWCHVMSCDVMWCHVMSVMSCDVWCHVMSVMSCDVMWCDLMWCHVMSYQFPCFHVHTALFEEVNNNKHLGERIKDVWLCLMIGRPYKMCVWSCIFALTGNIDLMRWNRNKQQSLGIEPRMMKVLLISSGHSPAVRVKAAQARGPRFNPQWLSAFTLSSILPYNMKILLSVLYQD